MRLSKTFRFIWLLTIFHSRSDSLASCRMWVWATVAYFFLIFLNTFLKFPPMWCTYSAVYMLRGWYHVKLLPSWRVLCPSYNSALRQVGWVNPQIYVGVHACLAVTCRQHFWQNDRDLLRATVVTRGWNDYWNKSQHRKFTLEKKILQLGLEPATF